MDDQTEEKPRMIEPSLLDYLKSKFRFWDRSSRVEVDAGRPLLDEDGSKKAGSETNQLAADLNEPSRRKKIWPWRSLLGLSLALLGQRAFEPSNSRNVITGLVFYGFGLTFLVWSYMRKEWILASYPEMHAGIDRLQVRGGSLILGFLFALAAFLTFNNNLFTVLNVVLWVLAIIFFIWAFWLPRKDSPSFWSRFNTFTRKDGWQIKVTRWALLIFVVVGLVIFFRVYRLSNVPLEPTSDHREKLMDVYDITQGMTHIFFPRNTGREGFQMYLTAAVAWLFQTGISFMSLKIGTVLCGLAVLPFIYLLGRELGNRRVGLLAVLFIGIAYWPNVIARIGLRFELYPFFLAPTLYYLLHGLHQQNRNDFLLSGLFLGLGLHGYTPFRIVPLVVIVVFIVYLLHSSSRGRRTQAVGWLCLLAVIALVLFLPLLRYMLDNPQQFFYRAFTRVGTLEKPLPGPWWEILLSNLWNALCMFNWNDGSIWNSSVLYRPALDIVSGVLFIIGMLMVVNRYLQKRKWQDIFLLLSIPLLQLPSSLSLAFPAENPALNRAAGVMIPTFLIVALAMDGLLSTFGIRSGVIPEESSRDANGKSGDCIQNGSRTVITRALGWLVLVILVCWSSIQNYDLVFNQYQRQYSESSENSSEMGTVIKYFGEVYGTTDSVWIVPFPYWVDTILPGMWAGIPDRDFAIWPDDLPSTTSRIGPKLFMVNLQDIATENQLSQLYPNGEWSRFVSKSNFSDKDFMIFFVPSGH